MSSPPVDGDNRDPWPDALWEHPEPDINTTINLNEEGLSEGDTIDSYISTHKGENVHLTVDPGTYDWNRTEPTGSYENLWVQGLGDPGDVVLDQGECQSSSFNLYAEGSGAVVFENFRIIGTVDEDENARMRLDARDESAEMILKWIWLEDGECPGGAENGTQGFYVGSVDDDSDNGHRGTIRLLWCKANNFSDNGSYLDGYTEIPAKGQAIWVGGLYSNCAVSNTRIGNNHSTMYGVTIVQDTSPTNRSSTSQRGVRIRRPDSGDSVFGDNNLLISNCDIWWYSGANGSPIDFSGSLSSSHSAGMFTDCRITNHSSNRAISSGGESSSNWTFRDIQLSGDGDLRTSGYDLEGNSEIGSSAEPADPTPWYGDDVSAPGTPGTGTVSEDWKRRYSGFYDNFEIGSIRSPYNVRTGSATSWQSDSTNTAPGSERSLKATGGSSTELFAEVGEGLQYYPDRTKTSEIWIRQSNIRNGVQNRIRHFLEESSNGYSGYDLRIYNGNIEVYEYVDDEPGSLIGGDSFSGMSSNTWYKVIIDPNDITITYSIEDESGSTLAEFSIDQEDYDGANFAFWCPSSTENSEEIWFDQFDYLEAEPDVLVENFDHGDIDENYDRESTAPGVEVLEDFEDYEENLDVYQNWYNASEDSPQWRFADGQGLEGNHAMRNSATNENTATDTITTERGYRYSALIRVPSGSGDAHPGLLVGVQELGDSNTIIQENSYVMRADHRDNELDCWVETNGTQNDRQNPSVTLNTDTTYRVVWELHDNDTIAKIENPDTDAVLQEVEFTGDTTFSDGYLGFFGPRDPDVLFDYITREDLNGTGGGQVWDLETEEWVEAGYALEYRGTSEGFERLDYGPDNQRVSETRVKGSFNRMSTQSDTITQFRFGVDESDAADAYVAIEFDVSNSEVSLKAKPYNESEETLDTRSVTYEVDEWGSFDIQWDSENTNDFTVSIDTTASTATLAGSHSESSAYGDMIGWYGEGETGEFLFDEVHIPGGELDDIDAPDDPDDDDPDDPDDEVPRPPERDESERWPLLHTLSDATERVRRIDWEPGENALAVGSNGGVLHVYDVNESDSWPAIIEFNYSDDIQGVQYSNDGDSLAIGELNGTVYVYETVDYDTRVTLSSSQHIGDTAAVAWNPDDTEMAVATTSGYVFIYDTSSWDRITTLNHNADGAGDIRSVEYSPDGEYLAFPSRASETYVYRTDDYDSPYITFTEGDGDHRGVAWSSDSSKIAYGGQDSLVWVRSVDHESSTWDEIEQSPLDSATDNIWFLDFSPSDQYLAFTQHTGPTFVHNAQGDWDLRLTLDEAGDRTTNGVAFSPNNRYLAYGSRDTNVYVHGVPIEATAELEGFGELEAEIERTNVFSGTAEMHGAGTLEGDAIVTGPKRWFLDFENERIRVDGITPSETQTLTPGEEVSITCWFTPDNDTDGESYLNRYEEIRKYGRVSASNAVVRGLTDETTAWYRERVAAFDDIDSLLVRFIPSAGIIDADEFWAVIIGVSDQSNPLAENRLIDIELFILDPQTAIDTHDEARDHFEARIF